MTDQLQIRMTAAEFFELPETNTPMELIDGEVIRMPSPIPDHQDIVTNFVVILKPIAKILGGKVFVAPLDVYLDEHNVPQPDVMWIAPNSRCIIGEKRLIGAPDLIVEVLSPSTGRSDKKTKFRLYEKYQAREYWIVDPVHRLIEVWQLVEGRFIEIGIYGTDETFNSPVLGNHAIEVNAIFNG